MLLDEARIPISEEVKGACEILGLDPLYVANEGKLLAILPAADANRVLAAMRAHPSVAQPPSSAKSPPTIPAMS
jgi:hydrogenase expression/formation protein HypE